MSADSARRKEEREREEGDFVMACLMEREGARKEEGGGPVPHTCARKRGVKRVCLPAIFHPPRKVFLASQKFSKGMKF